MPRLHQSEAAFARGYLMQLRNRLERARSGIVMGQLLHYLNALCAGISLAQLHARQQPVELSQQIRFAVVIGDRSGPFLT